MSATIAACALPAAPLAVLPEYRWNRPIDQAARIRCQFKLEVPPPGTPAIQPKGTKHIKVKCGRTALAKDVLGRDVCPRHQGATLSIVNNRFYAARVHDPRVRPWGSNKFTSPFVKIFVRLRERGPEYRRKTARFAVRHPLQFLALLFLGRHS